MKIAVYAIAKDEDKHVDSWYDTGADADYQVLVDTGSEDGTSKYARYFVSVQPFRFDVARNAALALVPSDADVCISLDLDERLRPGWRDIIEREYAKADKTAATRYAVWYNTPGMQPFIHNSRIHSRAGFVWRDPCHEYLQRWMLRMDTVEIPDFTIDHFPDRNKPRTSYLQLLAFGLDEEPWNSRRIFYYARELLVYHEYEKALGWFKKYQEGWELDPQREEHHEIQQCRAYIELAEGAIKERDARRL